jgi:hypothetical protein
MPQPMYGVDSDGDVVPVRVDTRFEKLALLVWRIAVLLTLLAILATLWVR